MSVSSKIKPVIRVFLSSTWDDLKPERSLILEAIRRLQFQHVAMEYFGADPQHPIDKCLEEVKRSNVYLGIIGLRYGKIVESTAKSYTEMEYDEARKNQLSCLIYFRNEDIPILPDLIERNPDSITKLTAFKERLLSEHTVYFFNDGHDLAVQVVADLSSLASGLTYREIIPDPVQPLRSRLVQLIDSAISEVSDPDTLLKDIMSYVNRSLGKTAVEPQSLFLCYTHSNKDFARKLAEDLISLGIAVWMDEGEIRPGDSLVSTIKVAIDRMDYFVILLSPQSVSSDWVKRELNIAIYNQFNKRSIKVIPILIADCEIPAILRNIRYLDMRDTNKYWYNLQFLLKSLQFWHR